MRRKISLFATLLLLVFLAQACKSFDDAVSPSVPQYGAVVVKNHTSYYLEIVCEGKNSANALTPAKNGVPYIHPGHYIVIGNSSPSDGKEKKVTLEITAFRLDITGCIHLESRIGATKRSMLIGADRPSRTITINQWNLE